MRKGYDSKKGYDEEYVAGLLEVVNYRPTSKKNDTDESYLDLAIKSCEAFNREFEGTFDKI